MSNQQGWAGGLALLSLVLAVGYSWWQKRQRGDPAGQVLAERWPGHMARFFYFVGLPYLALLFGILTNRLLGLKGLEYFGMAGMGKELVPAQFVVDFQYATVLMLLEWFVDGRSTIVAGVAALAVLGGIWVGLARSGISSITTGYHLSTLDIIYHGLHWSFYRAIFWLITGDLYLGVVLGAALVIVEAIFVAWLEAGRFFGQPHLLINGMILILTATIFFYSPNLWLLWPVHGAMGALIRMIDRPAAVAGPATPGKTYQYFQR